MGKNNWRFKVKKLKEILQESKYLKREFGEALPTFSGVMKQHQESKEPIKEAYSSKIPTFGALKDVSEYGYKWGKLFGEMENIDFGPRESDMYDWNSRANYQATTKEFHAHMDKMGKKLNSALKGMEDTWKVWDKILKKHRKNDER
jgi:hypothetical protein